MVALAPGYHSLSRIKISRTATAFGRLIRSTAIVTAPMSLRAQHRAFPEKVLIPHIESRLKKPRYHAARRDEARDVRTFVAVAVKTRQSKIRRLRRAVVFLRNDVLHLETNDRMGFGRTTVLAPPACSPAHFPRERRTGTAHSATGLRRDAFAFAFNNSRSRPTSP